MKSPQQQHIVITHPEVSRASFISFESVLQFDTFINTQLKKLSAANTRVFEILLQDTKREIQRNSDWYGTPIPKSIQELEGHTRFLGMHLCKQIEPKIKQVLHKYLDLTKDDILPKPKLSYNDRGLGVFSFDRAAMGLYRQEPTNNSTPFIQLTNQLKIALDRDNKGTIIKNVYTHFENKNTTNPTMELYVAAGANANIKGNALLYVGLAITQLVEFVSLRGIATKVNVILETAFNNKLYAAIITVKGFEHPLNKNQLLLLSSDPRYYRYNGFKALIAITDYLGGTIPKDLGSSKTGIAKAFIKEVNKENGIVFEQSYDLNTAVKEVIQIITNYTKKTL